MTTAPSVKHIATVTHADNISLSADVKTLLEDFLGTLGVDYVTYQTASTDSLSTGEIKLTVSNLGEITTTQKNLSRLLTELTFDTTLNHTDISLVIEEAGLVSARQRLACSWSAKSNCFGPIKAIVQLTDKILFSTPKRKARDIAAARKRFGMVDGVHVASEMTAVH